MSFSSKSTIAAFHRRRFGARCERPAEELGLKHILSVSLLTDVDGNTTRVRTAIVCGRTEAAATTLQLQMHNHSLCPYNTGDLIAIRFAVIVEEMKSHALPCPFHSMEEMLSTFGEVYFAGGYV